MLPSHPDLCGCASLRSLATLRFPTMSSDGEGRAERAEPCQATTGKVCGVRLLLNESLFWQNGRKSKHHQCLLRIERPTLPDNPSSLSGGCGCLSTITVTIPDLRPNRREASSARAEPVRIVTDSY